MFTYYFFNTDCGLERKERGVTCPSSRDTRRVAKISKQRSPQCVPSQLHVVHAKHDGRIPSIRVRELFKK